MINALIDSLKQYVDVLLSENTYIIHLVPLYKHKVDICVNGIRVQEDLDGFCYQYEEIIETAFNLLKFEYRIVYVRETAYNYEGVIQNHE
jgi:glycerol-3-phosphate cytidylyltransferase-like family protein